MHLRSMASYMGTSKSSIYQKQADLRKAAVGTAKLHNFFQPAAPTWSTTTAMVPSSHGYTVMPQKSTDRDATDSSDWEDVIEVVLPALPAPPSLQKHQTWHHLSQCQTLTYLTITQKCQATLHSSIQLQMMNTSPFRFPLALQLPSWVMMLRNISCLAHFSNYMLFEITLRCLTTFTAFWTSKIPPPGQVLLSQSLWEKGHTLQKRFIISSCISNIFTLFCLQDLEKTTHTHLFWIMSRFLRLCIIISLCKK